MNEYLGTVTPEGNRIEPKNNNCALCNNPWTKDDVRTISFIAENGKFLTYFYRIHKSCHKRTSDKEIFELESKFVDNLTVPFEK